MKEVYYDDGTVKKTFAYDHHIPGRFYREVVTRPEKAIEANKKIRSANLLPQDSRNPLVEGDVIAFSFSFPSHTDYMIAYHKDPELFESMIHGTDTERTRAAERIRILYPEYCVTVNRRDSRR